MVINRNTAVIYPANVESGSFQLIYLPHPSDSKVIALFLIDEKYIYEIQTAELEYSSSFLIESRNLPNPCSCVIDGKLTSISRIDPVLIISSLLESSSSTLNSSFVSLSDWKREILEKFHSSSESFLAFFDLFARDHSYIENFCDVKSPDQESSVNDSEVYFRFNLEKFVSYLSQKYKTVLDKLSSESMYISEGKLESFVFDLLCSYIQSTEICQKLSQSLGGVSSLPTHAPSVNPYMDQNNNYKKIAVSSQAPASKKPKKTSSSSSMNNHVNDGCQKITGFFSKKN
jgi:hypothetical protein